MCRRTLRPATVQRVVSKAEKMVMRSHSHLELGFKVWEDQQCWFWLVVSPQSDGGTVGAAATEVEAIDDARSSIETYQRSDCRRGPETGRMNGSEKAVLISYSKRIVNPLRPRVFE